MANVGPVGFRNTPITKVVVICTCCSSVILQVAHASRRRVPFIVSLFSKIFVFQHPGELVFGAILLYYFRLFERQLGSAKYGSFVVFATTVSRALEFSVGRLFSFKTPTGPYGLIFANFVTFMLDVPSLQRFSVFGWRMTDKVFLYLAGVQLLFTHSKASAFSAICGFATGLLYRSNFLGCRRWKLPRWLAQLFEPRTAGTPNSSLSSSAGLAAVDGQPSGQMASLSAPAPSQEALEQLVAMGFDRNQAAHALQQSGNNVQVALSLLL